MFRLKPIPFVLVVFLLAGCSDPISIHQLEGYGNLIDRHATTTAKVTFTRCNDHGRIEYAFEVGSKRFTGHSYYWKGRSCPNVNVGDVFAVNYDPEDPTISTDVEPEEAFDRYRNYFWGTVGVCLLGAGSFLWPSFKKFRTRKKTT